MQRYFIFLLLLGVFFVSSCKKELDQASEDLPSITDHATILWQKTIPSQYYCEDEHFSPYGMKDQQNMTVLQDGSIAMFYATLHDNAPGIFFDFTKIDSAGNLIFVKSYGIPSEATILNKASIFATSDNGYLLFYNFFNGIDYKACIIKTDINGNTLWEQNFPFWSFTLVDCMTEKTNGNYIGIVEDSLKNYLLEMTANGVITDTSVISTDANINSIAIQQNGDIIIAGNHCVDGMMHYNGDLMAINNSGNIIWQKEIEGCTGDNYLHISGIQLNTDNSIAIIGNTKLTYNYVQTFAKYNSSGDLISQTNLNTTNLCNDIEAADAGGYLILSTTDRQLTKISESGSVEWKHTLINLPDFFVGLTLKRTGNNYLAFGFIYPQGIYYSQGFLIKFSVY